MVAEAAVLCRLKHSLKRSCRLLASTERKPGYFVMT